VVSTVLLELLDGIFNERYNGEIAKVMETPQETYDGRSKIVSK